MTDMNETTKQTVMDIAMNLNRIGNWIADDFDSNLKKINIFIANTDGYIANVTSVPVEFDKTWSFFLQKYPEFKNNLKNNAENFMTYGNILTHRARLIE